MEASGAGVSVVASGAEASVVASGAGVSVVASGVEAKCGAERRGGEAWMPALSAQRGGCGAEGAAGEQNGGLSRHS